MQTDVSHNERDIPTARAEGSGCRQGLTDTVTGSFCVKDAVRGSVVSGTLSEGLLCQGPCEKGFCVRDPVRRSFMSGTLSEGLLCQGPFQTIFCVRDPVRSFVSGTLVRSFMSGTLSEGLLCQEPLQTVF